MTSASEVENVDKSDHPKYAERLQYALSQFDNKVLKKKNKMVIYVSAKTELAMRAEYSARLTAAGDDFLLKDGKLTFQGIPVKVRDLADDCYVIGLAKFIILGYRTDVDLKIEHKGSEWKWYWYIRVRFGITYVDSKFIKAFKEVE